jgi:SAM-dependent methyltransferase/uncharacterized protein YbaR (Trm112 family)
LVEREKVVMSDTGQELALLVCPKCRGTLHTEPAADRFGPPFTEAAVCDGCASVFPGRGGSFDFVLADTRKAQEKEHYETKYTAEAKSPADRRLDVEYWRKRWNDPHWAECPIILKYLGDLKDKRVLCLGNGSSIKEFHFLTLGAYLCHSDLSFSGILQAKTRYDLSAFDGRVMFHALDAYAIPFPDRSFDIVYGFEFVHHLPNLPAFFQEVYRVLKPGGRSVFCDPAFSALWQKAKLTVFRPLMKLSHWLHGISPEDRRMTYIGGYREDMLTQVAAQQGIHHCFFERTMLFQYLFIAGLISLAGWNGPMWCYRVPGWIGRGLDWLLTDRIGFLSRNRTTLVWGFEKPSGETT